MSNIAIPKKGEKGIIIPAGDWTLDINGNVNAFATSTRAKGDKAAIAGGLAATKDSSGTSSSADNGRNTGLLPAWLGFTGKTRQNDVDVEFTISINPNGNVGSTGDNDAPLFRQSYLSFGDKSWGSIKLGKDLGIFASDAILNDMTLQGVGSGLSSNATELGGIGTGYIYSAWKGQVAYTTPNFNGFQATVGITNPNQVSAPVVAYGESAITSNALYQDRFGFEGKASYNFAAGQIWLSGASHKAKTDNGTNSNTVKEYTANVYDIGANINTAGFGLTGYYYSGKGVGTTYMGHNAASADGGKRDSDGGYLQLTYVLPTQTKIGLSYGISNLDLAAGEATSNVVDSNERFTLGAYHPLTKHLNLVAEYNDIETRAHNGSINESQTTSVGAILFF